MVPHNRPRPFAERPAAPAVPANDNATGVLGVWQDGDFRFTSSAAKEQWVRRAYEQGVSPDNWHLGKEIDPQSAGIAKADLAGAAMPGLYLGPDNKYRLMNSKTIEAQAARDHRNQFLVGKTLDHLATATGMPGADEWVAKWKAQTVAANDNGQRQAVAAPATLQQAIHLHPPRTPLRRVLRRSRPGAADLVR